MNLKETLELWDMCVTERVTGNRLVYPSPCWVLAVHCEPIDGTAVIAAHLLDGQAITSPCKICFTNAYGSARFTPPVPMKFEHSLFVYNQTNMTGMTLIYLPLRARG